MKIKKTPYLTAGWGGAQLLIQGDGGERRIWMIGKKKRSIALFLVSMLLVSALAGCGAKNKEDPGDTQTDTSSQTTWENPLTSPRGESDYVPKPKNVTKKLSEAKAENSDVVGWLQIPGTEVDEAVVQAKDNEYYYRRDAQKNQSFAGSLWLDYESVVGDGSAKKLSQNMIIYGHNLGNPQGVKDDPNGVKFAQLFKFDNLEFAANHPYFYFTTEAETHIYEIFTVFYSEDQLKPVPYHFAEYKADDFKELIADVRNRSQFDYNVEVGPEDKIMSLSTCTYKYGTYSKNPHQRFVVMGRLVGKGETFYDTADVKENPDPKAPQFAS